MPIADWSPDDEMPDPARLRPRIAGMGYRLAAAGPRTRQRMIEREAGFPPPDEVRYANPLAAILPRHETPWPASIGEAPEAPLVRLSAPRRGFPVWRSIALMVSAICGFSLVIFGQTLHLDRTFRSASKTLKPALADDTPEIVALDARPLAAAAPQSEPFTLASETRATILPPQLAPLPPPAPVQSAAETGPPLAAINEARPPAAPRVASQLATRTATQRHPAPHPYAALTASSRHIFGPGSPELAQAEARHTTSRPAHYELPSWLTKPRPDARPEPPRALVMSPQPKTLDEQFAAKNVAAPQQQLAAAGPSPQPLQPQAPRKLPPIPAPHSPPIIYAEAHYPQTSQHLPPPTPYYQPYYGYGGYYQQPAPYYYGTPPSSW